jgi:hypothetical protein
MKLRNDYLHSLLVKTASSVLTRKRDILKGSWNGEKCICISFDCDFQEDMKACAQVVNQMVTNEVFASFAIPWHLANDFPHVIDNLLENQQEILNHTLTHPSNFRSLPTKVIRREIEDYQSLMSKTYNYSPKGFRCPHGMRKINYELFSVLKENEMYDSSLIGQATTNINGTWEILLTHCPEHPSMAFDSYHHFRFPLVSSSEKKFLQLWKTLLLTENFINVFLDPIDFTSEARLVLFEEMIKAAKERDFVFRQMHQIHEEIKKH